MKDQRIRDLEKELEYVKEKQKKTGRLLEMLMEGENQKGDDQGTK